MTVRNLDALFRPRRSVVLGQPASATAQALLDNLRLNSADPALKKTPRRTVVACGACSVIACSASVTASRIVRAYRRRTRPAVVSRTPSVRRSNSAVPALRSRDAACREIADCV